MHLISPYGRRENASEQATAASVLIPAYFSLMLNPQFVSQITKFSHWVTTIK